LGEVAEVSFTTEGLDTLINGVTELGNIGASSSIEDGGTVVNEASEVSVSTGNVLNSLDTSGDEASNVDVFSVGGSVVVVVIFADNVLGSLDEVVNVSVSTEGFDTLVNGVTELGNILASSIVEDGSSTVDDVSDVTTFNSLDTLDGISEETSNINELAVEGVWASL